LDTTDPAIFAIASAVGFALGCHSEPPQPSQLAPSVAASPSASAREGDGVDADAASTVEALALLSNTLAPGMRELTRGESPLPATIPLEATDGDANACVRAVLGSASPVVGALVSDGGRLLDVTVAAKTATLGTHGPVCLQKNQAAHIEVQGPAGPVRYVVWVTP
jgi:hypothetical protein